MLLNETAQYCYSLITIAWIYLNLEGGKTTTTAKSTGNGTVSALLKYFYGIQWSSRVKCSKKHIVHVKWKRKNSPFPNHFLSDYSWFKTKQSNVCHTARIAVGDFSVQRSEYSVSIDYDSVVYIYNILAHLSPGNYVDCLQPHKKSVKWSARGKMGLCRHMTLHECYCCWSWCLSTVLTVVVLSSYIALFFFSCWKGKLQPTSSPLFLTPCVRVRALACVCVCVWVCV